MRSQIFTRLGRLFSFKIRTQVLITYQICLLLLIFRGFGLKFLVFTLIYIDNLLFGQLLPIKEVEFMNQGIEEKINKEIQRIAWRLQYYAKRSRTNIPLFMTLPEKNLLRMNCSRGCTFKRSSV